MMRPKTPLVPVWVRSTMCVIAAAAVPGLLVAACFGTSPSMGVSFAIASFAVGSARLAFGKDPNS